MLMNRQACEPPVVLIGQMRSVWTNFQISPSRRRRECFELKTIIYFSDQRGRTLGAMHNGVVVEPTDSTIFETA